jgi:ABC-type nitrate/sulfonate/bicarbonate transport system substrate-binding protein
VKVAFRWFSWLVTSLCLLFFLASGVQAQPVKVRAVYPAVDVQYLPASLAQARGFFREEGLDVELIVMRGGTLGVQAAVGGNVDFVMQFGSVFPAIWGGADLKILAQMTNALFFSLIVRPEIQKIADLKGKKIGVTIGAATFAAVRELLKLNGIDPDKGVEYVNIPGSGAKVAALEKGLIAATLVAPPGELKSIQAGYRRLVFFGNVLPEMSFTGLVATNRYIRENPKTIERMIRAIVRGTYLARDDSVAAIGAMQSHMKMAPDEARETYRLIQKSFNPNLTEAGVRTTAELVASSLGAKPMVEPKDYMDLSFLKRVLSDTLKNSAR